MAIVDVLLASCRRFIKLVMVENVAWRLNLLLFG